MPPSDIAQLAHLLRRVETLRAAGSARRPAPPAVPDLVEDAFMEHLSRGLQASKRVLRTPPGLKRNSHMANAVTELRAAVVMLEEWLVREDI